MDRIKTRDECPICFQNKYNVLLSENTNQGFLKKYLNWRFPKFNTDNYFLCIIVECKNCKLIFHKNYLNDYHFNKYPKLTDSNFHKYKKFLKKKKDKRIYGIYKKNINLIFNILGKNINANILDFGSGWGDWIKSSNSFGFNTYGAEIDTFKLKYLNKNKLTLIDFDKIDPNLKFDFINTEQVFEHLENPVYFIKKFSKILKHNGLVRISVPNGIKVKKNLNNNDNWLEKRKGNRNSLNPVWLFEHINCFRPETIIYMMEINGFKHFKLPFYKFLTFQFGKVSFLRLFYDAIHHSFLLRKTNLYFIKN